MRLKLVGAVSALALFAGLSTAAFAQGTGGAQPPGQERERMQTPGQGSTPGRQQTGPGEQGSPGRQQGLGPRRGGEQAQSPERGQERTQRQQAQEPDGKQPRRAEQPDSKQRQRAEEPDRKQPQRAEQPDRKQPDRAERPDSKQPQRADQPDRKRQQAQRPDQRLSAEQRVTVRERIRESGELDRARVANVDFNISVGTRVPRDRVRLATLPSVIVEEVPHYRGYRFFVVRDEIVIVEPDTYVIVDVVRLDGAGRTARVERRLTLTDADRDVILSHVDLDPDIRLGIGGVSVGMDVPGTIVLREFPTAVVDEVPELSSYRYFVFENEVAVVSPDERRVVLTINE